MPVWRVSERSYDLPRDIAFLDSNVLVALFDSRDGWHDQTVAAIELAEYSWAITHACLIESWNMLVGRLRRPDLALGLMTWALTPGNAILVGDAIEHVGAANTYSERFKIDLVDANLIELADRVSRECGMIPAAQIATYDTRDFLRLFGASGLNFNVYDLRNISSTSD